jgi:hypothetical protein
VLKDVVYLSEPYECEFEVRYHLTKYYPATLETPEEPADIDVAWVRPLTESSDEDGFNEWIRDENQWIEDIYWKLSEQHGMAL